MDGIWTLLIVVTAFAIYFMPTIVAVQRGVRNQGSVMILNLFLGWTLVGWVVALAMAARSVEQPA